MQRSAFLNYDLYEHAKELMNKGRQIAFRKIMNRDYKLTDPFTLKDRNSLCCFEYMGLIAHFVPPLTQVPSSIRHLNGMHLTFPQHAGPSSSLQISGN
jgi:hypothetical protein